MGEAAAAWTGRPGTLHPVLIIRPGYLNIGVYRVHNDIREGELCKGVGVQFGWIWGYEVWGLLVQWGWARNILWCRTRREMLEQQRKTP